MASMTLFATILLIGALTFAILFVLTFDDEKLENEEPTLDTRGPHDR
jgi:hypothetical protein